VLHHRPRESGVAAAVPIADSARARLVAEALDAAGATITMTPAQHWSGAQAAATATERFGAASWCVPPADRCYSRETPAIRGTSARSSGALDPRTSRYCLSARTSRAGSWHRNT